MATYETYEIFEPRARRGPESAWYIDGGIKWITQKNQTPEMAHKSRKT